MSQESGTAPRKPDGRWSTIRIGRNHTSRKLEFAMSINTTNYGLKIKDIASHLLCPLETDLKIGFIGLVSCSGTPI
jgi:hypothetical protein